MYDYGSSGNVKSWRDNEIQFCDFCMKIRCGKLFVVSQKDKFLARKLVPGYMKENLISSHGLPHNSCQSCYKKLYHFKHFLRKYLRTSHLNKKHLENIANNYKQNTQLSIQQIKQEIKAEEPEIILQQNNHNNIKHIIIMTSPSHDDNPETTEVSSSTATNKHEYNCQCGSCQNKYGDLPLLVQVIEQKVAIEERLHFSSVPEIVVTSSSSVFNNTTEPSTSSSSSNSTELVNSLTSKTAINTKELQCLHCEKHFNHRGDFNKHLRKHTKERPFSCTECHKKFTHTSNLHRHVRIHSGDKPFVCTVCDKGFNRKDKLDSHKRSRLCRSKAGEKDQ